MFAIMEQYKKGYAACSLLTISLLVKSRSEELVIQFCGHPCDDRYLSHLTRDLTKSDA